MTEQEPQVEQEVGRFYTQIRRFKKVIGRFHDGTKIPGGPYGLAQVAFAAIAGVALNLTRGIWTTGNVLIDMVSIVLLTWAVAWISGKLPATKRNPATLLLDAGKAAVAPAEGKYQGKVTKLKPPHRAGTPVRKRPPAAHDLPAREPLEDLEAVHEQALPVPSAAPRIVATTALDRLRQKTRQS